MVLCSPASAWGIAIGFSRLGSGCCAFELVVSCCIVQCLSLGRLLCEGSGCIYASN